MAAEIPKTIKQWNVTGKSFVDSLEFSEQPVPEIGDTQVLVKRKGFLTTYMRSAKRG